MKCSECGKENAEHLFYCGECGAELFRPPTVTHEPVDYETPSTQPMHAEPEAKAVDPMIDALVAVAINVRRIFLVLLLSIFVTLFGSSLTIILTVLMINDDLPGSAISVVPLLWLGLIMILLVIGVIYIITNKRLTVPGK